MLRDWLSPTSYGALHESRKDRRAFASVEFGWAKPWLDWMTLERVLAARPAPDLLVVRQSALLPLPAPSTLLALRTLFARGAGVVIRRAEGQDAGLARLAAAFEAEFAERAHIQLFVTPRATHGFGWHYDIEDVLILQTIGSKQYYFRANTQRPVLEPGVRLDFSAIARETSALQTCTLAAGDALYLPRGTWHVAKALEDSLSMSVGLR